MMTFFLYECTAKKYYKKLLKLTKASICFKTDYKGDYFVEVCPLNIYRLNSLIV